MTRREIQGHLEEIYGIEISPSLISTVTDAVLDEVRAWQSRPLDAVYPILYPDALQVKVKSQGRVVNKAIHLAFGVNLYGLKEVLGMWVADNEGAEFRMQVVTELKNRGVCDIFVACVDGLKGFPEGVCTGRGPLRAPAKAPAGAVREAGAQRRAPQPGPEYSKPKEAMLPAWCEN
jgi:putative transposase